MVQKQMYLFMLPLKYMKLSEPVQNRCFIARVVEILNRVPGWKIVGFFIVLLGLTGCSASVADSANMLVNLSKSYPQIERLITGAAFLVGISLVMRAIYYLKIYGEMRTMMASQGNLKAPLIYLLVAVALMYLPQTLDDVMVSTFGTAEISPLNYNTSTGPGLNIQAANAILGFVRIVGLISFVRGWMIIAKSAQGGAQGVSFGKGATHILGGILAINIVGAKNALWATLGLS